MIVARLIVYSSDSQDRMEKQLSQSMPDGIKEIPGLTIRIATLPEAVLRAFGQISEFWK